MKAFFAALLASVVIYGGIFLLSTLAGCTAGPPTLAPFCSLEGEPTVNVGRVEHWIVGGVPSTEPESIVKVYMADGSCSGAVIGPRTVLTAAHCIYEGPATHVCPGFGNPCIEVVWSRYYPDYNRGSHFFGDVAVLHVAKDLPYEARPLACDDLECYHVMKSKGYGATNNELRGINEIGVVELVRDDFIIEVTRGACYGDSGSPLLAYDQTGQPHILGVSSHIHGSGRSCSEVASAGYALVFEFTDWILEQLAESEGNNEGNVGFGPTCSPS